MNKQLLTVLLLWFIFISFVTSVLTLVDKLKAKKGSFRISEKALFLLALSGGSVAEYFTMRLIRHKTLHKRFMIGLPVIIILQFIAITIIFLSLYST